MKFTDLLLPEKTIKELPYSLRAVADAASLHTAKVIRDELNRIDRDCVDTKQVDDKFQWLLHDLTNLIKEMEQK